MGEWESRELCPDDTCVGLIGADGRCKVCGKTSPRGARAPAGDNAADDVVAGAEVETADDLVDTGASSRDVVVDGEVIDGEPGAPDEWDRRTLCPDGACTGVIAAPGARCSVCKRTEAEIQASP